MDNEKLKEALDGIYKMLSAISVKGDAVDVMAAARCQLRALYAQLDIKGAETK